MACRRARGTRKRPVVDRPLMRRIRVARGDLWCGVRAQAGVIHAVDGAGEEHERGFRDRWIGGDRLNLDALALGQRLVEGDNGLTHASLVEGYFTERLDCAVVVDQDA